MAVTIEYERGLEQGKVVVPDFEAIRAKLHERIRYYLKAASECGPESDFDGVKLSTCSIEGSSVQCVRSKVGSIALHVLQTDRLTSLHAESCQGCRTPLVLKHI